MTHNTRRIYKRYYRQLMETLCEDPDNMTLTVAIEKVIRAQTYGEAQRLAAQACKTVLLRNYDLDLDIDVRSQGGKRKRQADRFTAEQAEHMLDVVGECDLATQMVCEIIYRYKVTAKEILPFEDDRGLRISDFHEQDGRAYLWTPRQRCNDEPRIIPVTAGLRARCASIANAGVVFINGNGGELQYHTFWENVRTALDLGVTRGVIPAGLKGASRLFRLAPADQRGLDPRDADRRAT